MSKDDASTNVTTVLNGIAIDKHIPIPAVRFSVWGGLLRKMTPGDSVELPFKFANSFTSYVRSRRGTTATRTIDRSSRLMRVWLVEAAKDGE